MARHLGCFGVLAIQSKSKGEGPHRSDVSYRIRLTSQSSPCVFSKNLALANKCAALFLQVRRSLLINLPPLIYGIGESCENENNECPQNQDDDAEDSFPLALLEQELYAFTLGLTQ